MNGLKKIRRQRYQLPCSSACCPLPGQIRGNHSHRDLPVQTIELARERSKPFGSVSVLCCPTTASVLSSGPTVVPACATHLKHGSLCELAVKLHPTPGGRYSSAHVYDFPIPGNSPIALHLLLPVPIRTFRPQRTLSTVCSTFTWATVRRVLCVTYDSA